MDYSRAKSPNIGNVLNARRLARRKLQRSAIREREKQEIEKKVNRKYNVIYETRLTSNLQSALDQNRLQKHRTSLYQFFFCFIDANFWNEVEGKRFVIRDDIPHVAVGYAGLSISKLKKDCLSITPQFVASVDTKKNWNFLTSNVFKTNTLLNDWKKNLIACNLISYQRKMYFRIYICRILYSLVVLVT